MEEKRAVRSFRSFSVAREVNGNLGGGWEQSQISERRGKSSKIYSFSPHFAVFPNSDGHGRGLETERSRNLRHRTVQVSASSGVGFHMSDPPRSEVLQVLQVL